MGTGGATLARLEKIILHSGMAPSMQQAHLQAVNLLRLLAEHRIAEFSACLEQLPCALITDPSSSVHRIVAIQQSLMEGSWARLAKCLGEGGGSAGNGILSECAFLVEHLMRTVR